MMKAIPGMDLEFRQGTIEDVDETDYLSVSQHNVIISMILWLNLEKTSVYIADLFKRGSHHKYLSVIYIVKNIFHQEKEIRITLNAYYIVMFKSPRDRQQIPILARQVSSDEVQEFMRSYDKATCPQYGYVGSKAYNE